MHWPFVIHQTYHRRQQIHGPFFGQMQGGISTPANVPGIFIFTGHGAGIIGYQDAFQADGTLRYTGQGQRGDMRMISGNRAIRDHAQNGKDLLLFEQTKKGSRVRFLGLFTCAGWEIERQPDIDRNERDAIVFTLAPLRELEPEGDDLTDELPSASSLAELRKRAFAAAAPALISQMGGARTVFARSRDVRDYVLARADGICEGCRTPAPFKTATGRPYLEAHHTRRLSDGGPDDPRFVVGICPNCHRRAHFSSDRLAFNSDLEATVHDIEAATAAKA